MADRLFARLRGLCGWRDTVAPRDNTGRTRLGRVRCWGNRRAFYVEGEPVPHLLGGASTYSVQTEEGWYVNVAKGRLCGWSDKPIHRVAGRTLLPQRHRVPA